MDEEYYWPEYEHIKHYAHAILRNTLIAQIRLRNLGQDDIFVLDEVFMPTYIYFVVKYQYDNEWSLQAIDKKYRDLYETPIQDRNDLWHANKALIEKTEELFNIL